MEQQGGHHNMKLKVNLDIPVGKIKDMHAVNNGPVYKRTAGQDLTNLHDYKAARIPYARTHDASICYNYGGEHTVDITAIFPDMNADPYDPNSYDFTLTDEYLDTIMLAGTKVFYRLGQKIEHWEKKYGIYAPQDPHKWAVICEHIIAHMNEGWADGHHMGIEYWEIWNEPNIVFECWIGTPQQYFELYAVTAKHLKQRFPNIKVGGPAIGYYDEPWLREFLAYVRDNRLPLDFYSWHRYATAPDEIAADARRHRALLEEYGLGHVESILNEWNYVKSFRGEDWYHSIKTMTGLKGAVFAAGVMASCQYEPVDMLMYYDARPTGMNGMFSMYTYEKMKTYYPIAAWSDMKDLGTACKISCDIPNIYAAAATGDDGKRMIYLCYYTDDDNALSKTFTVEVAGSSSDEYRLSLLDEEHNFDDVALIYADDGKFTLTMQPNTAIILR